MTVYSQNDVNWKNVKIGFDTGPSDTIGNYGCYMTAIANVCSWAGKNVTPLDVNNLAKQNGWLVSSDLIARDDIPSLICSNLQYVGKTSWNDAISMDFFKDASDPNVAYIICIDASKAPGIQTHFVMVWSTLGNGDLEINDSWDGVRKALSHYGNPSVIIQSATKFIKVATPSVPTAPLCTYTPQVPVKQMQTNKQPTHWWNLNNNSTDINNFHPAAELGMHVPFTVGGYAVNRHFPQYTYAMTPEDFARVQAGDFNTNNGVNILDLEDIPPAPYVPPAAPVQTPTAETYTLVTDLNTFDTDVHAMSDVQSTGKLVAGTYYVWKKTGRAYQLGTDNMHAPTGNWINTSDNIIKAPSTPVVSQPVSDSSSTIAGTFKWFHADHHPEEYTVLKDLVVYDMVHGGKPVRIDTGNVIEIFGYFIKDGYTYLRPLTGTDQQSLYYFYGIRTTDPHTFSGTPYLECKLNWTEELRVRLESLYEKAVRSLDGVFRRKKK